MLIAPKTAPEHKENVRHGETDFPIGRYKTRVGAGGIRVTPHWHEEAELTLIAEGGCICGIQLESSTVAQGDLVFVPPQQLHSFHAEGAAAFAKSRTFVFHMNLLGGGSGDVCALRYLAPLSSRKLLPPTVIRKGDPIHGEASRLFSCWNRFGRRRPRAMSFWSRLIF